MLAVLCCDVDTMLCCVVFCSVALCSAVLCCDRLRCVVPVLLCGFHAVSTVFFVL